LKRRAETALTKSHSLIEFARAEIGVRPLEPANRSAESLSEGLSAAQPMRLSATDRDFMWLRAQARRCGL
jgi:hypothetical protein